MAKTKGKKVENVISFTDSKEKITNSFKSVKPISVYKSEIILQDKTTNQIEISPKISHQSIISNQEGKYFCLIKPNTKIQKTEKNKIENSSETKTSSGSIALKVIGWILIVVGLIVLWAASIVGGILILIGGLLFVIAGSVGSSSSNTKNNQTTELQDVVYLKNGSIVRGTIIEQVINVSLKIQTSDGSVFVYKIDEIEKITKEPKTN